MQFMCFLKARPERTGAFRQWFLESLAPRLLEMAPVPVQRLIVNLADCPPAGFAIYGGAEVTVGPQYEVILQVWCESGADFERLLAVGEAELQEWVEVLHCYRITETEVLHKPDLLVGKPTPGYKLLRGLFFHEDMPDSAVQRSWERHQHLAVKVHVGLARYVRHWVDEVLSEDAPAIRGLSELHFPSEEALLERYFDSPRGQEEILHDIGHFIGGGTHRFFAREHVLKPA
ncbi:hypothetical protein SAMN05216201_10534 [Pseudomonas linyingensis]|uniref:EthD domain-containing protein n=1 Tax=Pseudomonas linyingensis TaxID=915471 RepID=A0A1H6WJ43_9PSED|nr:hypothetical protein [Pseudomonas linyingensis]SEJ14127.1 hypothetical protein SAMN05216201_10534 [Pseudomonas linyingensis]